MPRDKRLVATALLRKGFRLREGDHAFFTYYTPGGKRTAIFTKASHSHKVIPKVLMGLMARQCKLTAGEFHELVDCTLSREGYDALLRERGYLAERE